MQINSYKQLFVAIGLIGILIFASPTIAVLIEPPSGQRFSEIYILGPNYTLGSIPYNVESNVRYLIYLGVTNELGHSSYYRIFVKLGNQYDSFPDITHGLPSTLPTLYEYNLFVRDRASWQAPFTFQVNDLTFESEMCVINSITFNGIDSSVIKTSAWDSERKGYYYNLIFELWIYNSTSAVLEYNHRFVVLRLNITE